MNRPLVGAIELGGTKINLAIGSGPDDLRAEARVPTTDPDRAFAEIIGFLKGNDDLKAVGISCFGPIVLDRASPDWGTIARTTKAGWSHTPVGRAIADATALPVALDTDVNGAALGEYRWGALQGAGVGLYLTIGTGIGGGLVIAGKPLHGHVHPEMGHIRIKRMAGDDFPGLCPFHEDCFEGLASGPAITARLGATLSEVDPADPRTAPIFDALGQGIASLTLAFSPHRIVIGGGVAQSPGFHMRVAETARTWLGGYAAICGVGIVAPALGDRAGICGSIALAHDLLA